MDHQSPLERQAFINHTGQDQEAKLVATKLSEDLRNRDVHTFIDFKSLEISSDWRLKLEQNARCSQVFVAIVSLSYGTRKWCLHELDLAMHPPRPDRTIIPVYLGSMRPNVLQEPPEAWKQFWREMAGAAGTGSTQAMHVERWADNLRQLERFQGYVLSNYGGKDAVWKLERAVAAQILKQLPPKLVIHCVGQSGPLGLNTAASDVVARCSVHQSVAIVGPGEGRFRRTSLMPVRWYRKVAQYWSLHQGHFAM